MSKELIFVVIGLKTNLLGLSAITALNLVQRVETLTTGKDQVTERFPALFKDLDTLGEPYHIELKDDAKPHAIHPARNVPLALRDKVKGELGRM